MLGTELGLASNTTGGVCGPEALGVVVVVSVHRKPWRIQNQDAGRARLGGILAQEWLLRLGEALRAHVHSGGEPWSFGRVA